MNHSIPYALRPMRIMVAGKKMPANIRKRLHPLDWRPQRDNVRRLAVVDVARDQNMRSAARAGQFTEALDRGETRLPQRFFLAAELFEDLPICQSARKRMSPSRRN